MLMIFFFVVLYKALLKRWNKGNVKHEDFCDLVSIEFKPAFGIIDFCFTSKGNKHIDFEIVNLNFETVVSIASKEFVDGQHILKFDTNQLADGDYFYLLKTENQKIFKKIQINNSVNLNK
jgi:hypothetical protein